ncbi:DNA alkylation repair protein [Candidatus Woesearchaeota archaeon]|jgi:3-methyladenine DNA glycosylase AlkD|nr:DNA alkylation repair protein [Candidatus Woesearchaeota archaeon]MBT4835138.1 DNA alkylation repair protein [Candidatus Woesearchaeota archaeon]MBT7170060.1 DNA alkylation repair protein [Candidatus Woesearchaeota archaeon]
MLKKLISELDTLSNKEKAEIHSKFFKTGKGDYGEGSIFLGIPVPILRKVAKRYQTLSLDNIQKLLDDKIHTYRFVAIIILVKEYEMGNDEKKKEIYEFYLKNLSNINNWDLVDVSAPNIIGNYLYNQPKIIAKKTLQTLAISKNLWKRRIAIVSTFFFIRQNRFEETIEITKILLKDKHDLIHKACGWMLREVGKRNQKVLESFLDENIKKMPRTMLRYSIEKFEEGKRKSYLKK